MPEPDRLWQRILQALSVSKLDYPSHFTPAEVATDFFCRRGDERVSRFVWKYYYPMIYGQQSGELLRSDAERIAEELERDLGYRKPGRQAESAGSWPQSTATCSICGRKQKRS